MRVLAAQEQPDWQELIPGMAETGQPSTALVFAMNKLKTKAVEGQQKVVQQKQQGDLKLEQMKKQAQQSSRNGKGASSQKPSSKKSGK